MKFKVGILATILLLALTPWAHASDPIPGLDVKLGKNPGGSGNVSVTTTARDGGFRFDKPLPAGEYQLTLSWDAAVRIAAQRRSATKPNASDPAITLTFQVTPQGDGAERRQYQPLIIRKAGPGAAFSVPKGGAIISGTVSAD